MVRLLAGATDPMAAGGELLARRDCVLEEQSRWQGMVRGVEGDMSGTKVIPAECAICLEEYDGQERCWAEIRLWPFVLAQDVALSRVCYLLIVIVLNAARARTGISEARSH